MARTKNRSKTYNILNNIFSAITHGIGFGLAVAGLVVLIVKAAHTGSALRVTAFTLYGSSLVILYLFSTLYHSLIFTRARRVFQIFDHSSIFILITGTYTPYTLVAIGGVKGWVMFGIILALAIFGILFYIFNQGKHVVLDTILYVLMGWIVIIASSTLLPSSWANWILALSLGRNCLYCWCYFIFNARRSLYSCDLAHVCCIRFNSDVFFNSILCLKKQTVNAIITACFFS